MVFVYTVLLVQVGARFYPQALKTISCFQKQFYIHDTNNVLQHRLRVIYRFLICGRQVRVISDYYMGICMDIITV